MSVFDGEIEFQSVTMKDFVKKDKPKSPRRKPVDDDCLIVGLSRDALRPKEVPRRLPDLLCPLDPEYYKDAIKRFSEDYPKVAKKHMSGDLDPVPIENDIQDRKRTEYQNRFCPRDLPFLSANPIRRAKALHSFRLPDDSYIPDTVQRWSYRRPHPDNYKEKPSTLALKPTHDNTLTNELRRILRVRTGDSVYRTVHSLLGEVVLDCNP